MKIKISTKVNSDLKTVISGFDKKLFLSLNPPFPPVKLLRFDGCKMGDQVTLELNFLLFKQTWISKIVDDRLEENQWYFVDEGEKLPFFLKTWTHKHLVNRIDEHAVIIDHIQYSTGTILSDILMYPVLLLQFLYRKPVYKRVFSESPAF